ncbi:glycosyltransferase [Zavarzinia sp.]|uniref:glycosyltransferase n=1 Tax=Zavarzinia sp. TaxID=2027920 RepID=UPI003BB7B8EB
MPRVMIISHGHPDLSHGGAERASYAIHALIRGGEMPGWDSVYAARADRRHIGHDGEFGSFRGRPDEILVAPPEVDHLYQSSTNIARLYEHLDDLVRHFAPNIVHIHHFMFWGIELFEYFEARGIPTVITLHEFMAICHRYGQMMKTNNRLCSTASPGECAQCFPDIASGMFFLRERMFLDQLGRANAIVSPSEFLAERVRRWSRGRLRVEVIENPRALIDYEPVEIGSPPRPGEVLRIGYFGQINQFKGTEVLLDAALILRKRGVNLHVRLFGVNLDVQEESFRQRIQAKLAELADTVEFFGPYHNAAVLRLMTGCDAVVVPSVWWENSPMVIQEAINANVHLIGSRHGGVEEKLKPYTRSILFEPGSALDLAEKIAELAERAVPEADAATGPMLARKTAAEAWRALLTLYQDLAVRGQGENVLDIRASTIGWSARLLDGFHGENG